MLRPCAVLLLLCSFAALGQNAADPGATVYMQHCASCHDTTAVRIPPRSALALRPSGAIVKALQSGAMKQQGAALSVTERIAVAQWLGRKTATIVSSSQLTNSCKDTGGVKPDKPQPSWTSWGGSLGNLRFQGADSAGLTAVDAQKLKLKWAFAVPDVTYLRSQPAVHNGQIILGGGQTIYSVHRSKPGRALVSCAPFCTRIIRDGRLRREPDTVQFLRLAKDENQVVVDKTS